MTELTLIRTGPFEVRFFFGVDIPALGKCEQFGAGNRLFVVPGLAKLAIGNHA